MTAQVVQITAPFISSKEPARPGLWSKELSDRSSGFTDLKSGDGFGTSLSLDGSYLAVGAPFDDSSNTLNTGAVYIFKRTGSTWALEQELSDQSSGFTDLKRGDEFGTFVALDGERLAVGVPKDQGTSGAGTGAVYIFKRTGSTWALEQELSDQSSGFTDLKAGDAFGTSLSLEGSYLAVGAPLDDGYTGTDTGAVYIFKRRLEKWHLEYEVSAQVSKLKFEKSAEFGKSLSLDGSYLAVGAPLDNGYTGTDTGAVYIFKRTGSTWALEQELSDQSSGFTDLKRGD